MVNDNIIVALANLNLKTEQEFDAYKDATYTTIFSSNTKRLYPKRIQIINDTGIDIEIDFILTEEEYAEYLANKAAHKYFILRTGSTLLINAFSPLPNAYKIVIKGTGTGVATKDLRIDLIAFTPNL